MSRTPLSSMQRTLTTLSHREPDRVPLFLLQTMQGARELGLSIEDYFSRADQVTEGQLRLHRKFGSDCLYPFYYAALETEAWGGSTLFMPDGPPLCGQPVLRQVQDIDTLRSPRIDEAPGLQRVLTTIRQLAAEVGDTVPIVGVVISPFSLPVMQMGFQPYLDLMFGPDQSRFSRLMQLNEDFAVAWANAQLAAGATAICYFDPVSSSTIVPRAHYLRCGHQVAQRTLARIQGPTATHMASGRCLGIVDDIAQTGTAVLGVSAQDDLRELKARAAGRVALLGNLNGIEMRRWTPAQTEFEVRKALAAAGRGGGFILSDNHGEIPWQVSDTVLLGIREAVERWGRYPLDWVDSWVPEAEAEAEAEAG